MEVLTFTVPPLLYYIASGYNSYTAGGKHLGRHNIGVFDLLFVRQGCLYMGEEHRRFELRAGEALILRPDRHHFGTEECMENTAYYWLHFHTTGSWSLAEDEPAPARQTPEASAAAAASGLFPATAMQSGSSNSDNSCHGPEALLPLFDLHPFGLQLPQYVALAQPAKMEKLLSQLGLLSADAHLGKIRFRQQLLFQEIVQELSAAMSTDRSSLSTLCAEQAASYLRSCYREDITAQRLGESLNFHPVYIARCMNKEYGCTPMEYLLRYRIEQSKLLLMQTGYTIARIAEEVGFNQAPYFSSSFRRLEGISPRQYRQRFS